MGSLTWWMRAWVVTAACLGAATLQAAPFLARIDAVMAAADQHLAGASAAPASYPPELRHIAWVQLAGDNLPDAFLVLKAHKDECAVAATGNAPCRALVLQATADGGYRVATEFTLQVHPVAFETGTQGVRALLYSRDTGAQPRYRRFAFNGTSFDAAGDLDPPQLGPLRAFMLDDRNMPSVTDQVYAARQFPNDAARLAPFRLHFDAIAISARRTGNPLVFDAAFESRVQVLLDALQPDAARLTSTIGWPQTLELRLWSCVDWMVSRRFWEVEDRRLGRIGLCADPAIFALKQGLVRSNAEFVALARYRLLREIGIAYLLRVAPVTLDMRLALKAPAAADETVFSGAAAGLLIGQALKLQSLDQAAEAHRVMQSVSTRWFEAYEREEKNYVRRTPELRAFDHELELVELALRCTRQASADGSVKPTPAPACPKDAAERVALLRQAVKESLTP